MRFDCVDNQFVEVGFPNWEFDRYSEWILVTVHAKSVNEEWSAIDLALELSDLLYCSQWFKQVSQNESPPYGGGLSFIEPCIWFELMNSHDSQLKEIDLILGAELYPDWDWDDENYIRFRFQATNEKLHSIAVEFQNEYDDFIKKHGTYIKI